VTGRPILGTTNVASANATKEVNAVIAKTVLQPRAIATAAPGPPAKNCRNNLGNPEETLISHRICHIEQATVGCRKQSVATTQCKERQHQRNHECDFPLVRSIKKYQQNNAVDTEYDRYGKEYTYLLAPFRAKRTKCHAIPGKTDD
jgi:hypothetical protein